MLQNRAGEMVRQQAAALLLALGHGATHWVLATIYVILPFLGQDLGLSFAQIGGLISIFHAASFLANAGSGALVDITGRYLTAAWLSLVFGASGLFLFGFASDLILPVAAIVVIGITHNLWHPAAISLLSRTYPAARGFALSIHTLGASVGDILAPTCAGALMLVLGWQSTAMVNALPALIVGGIVAILGPSLFGGGRVHVERKADDASYLGALKALASDRSIVLLCIMAGFRSMTQNGLMLFLPLYLVNELKAGPMLVGIAMTGIQAGALISGPLAGAMSDKLGRKPVVLICLAGTSIMIGHEHDLAGRGVHRGGVPARLRVVRRPARHSRLGAGSRARPHVRQRDQPPVRHAVGLYDACAAGRRPRRGPVGAGCHVPPPHRHRDDRIAHGGPRPERALARQPTRLREGDTLP